jgi:hypothetical protein
VLSKKSGLNTVLFYNFSFERNTVQGFFSSPVPF